LGLLAEESAISQRLGRLGKEKPLSLAASINITPTLIKMDYYDLTPFIPGWRGTTPEFGNSDSTMISVLFVVARS
jgi:hypothetical protein